MWYIMKIIVWSRKLYYIQNIFISCTDDNDLTVSAIYVFYGEAFLPKPYCTTALSYQKPHIKWTSACNPTQHHLSSNLFACLKMEVEQERSKHTLELKL